MNCIVVVNERGNFAHGIPRTASRRKSILWESSPSCSSSCSVADSMKATKLRKPSFSLRMYRSCMNWDKLRCDMQSSSYCLRDNEEYWCFIANMILLNIISGVHLFKKCERAAPRRVCTKNSDRCESFNRGILAHMSRSVSVSTNDWSSCPEYLQYLK